MRKQLRFYVGYMGFDLFRESFSSNKNTGSWNYTAAVGMCELFIKEEDSVCTGVQADAIIFTRIQSSFFSGRRCGTDAGENVGKRGAIVEVKMNRITGRNTVLLGSAEGT